MKINYVTINRANNDALFWTDIKALCHYLGCSVSTINKRMARSKFTHMFNHDIYKFKIHEKDY